MSIGRFFAGFAVGILAVLAMEALFSFVFWISLLIGIGVGVVVVIMLIAFSRGEQPTEVAQEVVKAARAVVTEDPTTVLERRANEQLFLAQSNLTLSGKGAGLVPVLATTIGKLRDAVNRSLEFAPDSETTFNLVKFATEDLPGQVGTFLTLAEKDIEKAEVVFSEQLQTMDARVEKLLGFINSNQRDAFDVESTFVDLKFNL